MYTNLLKGQNRQKILVELFALTCFYTKKKQFLKNVNFSISIINASCSGNNVWDFQKLQFCKMFSNIKTLNQITVVLIKMLLKLPRIIQHIESVFKQCIGYSVYETNDIEQVYRYRYLLSRPSLSLSVSPSKNELVYFQ